MTKPCKQFEKEASVLADILSLRPRKKKTMTKPRKRKRRWKVWFRLDKVFWAKKPTFCGECRFEKPTKNKYTIAISGPFTITEGEGMGRGKK